MLEEELQKSTVQVGGSVDRTATSHANLPFVKEGQDPGY